MGSLRAKLLQDWAPSGAVNFWLVADGAFLIQFYQEADLERALQGSPMPCGRVGDRRFHMELVDPDKNLIDQVGFTMLDELGPCGCSSTTSSPSTTSPSPPPSTHTPAAAAATRVRFFDDRPLVRSLSDGRREQVPPAEHVERSPTLRSSCGIIAHPAGHCPRRNLQQPFATAAATMARRERQVGSRTSSAREGQSRHEIEEEYYSGSSSDHVVAEEQPLLEPFAGTEKGEPTIEGKPAAIRRNRCPRCNILHLLSISLIRKKKEGKSLKQTNDKRPAVQMVAQQSSVQVRETDGIQTDCTLALRSPSQFKLRGGLISYSGSRTNPKIEVTVETQFTPQLMMKAMEWLSNNTGLQASYDGNKGKISIVGLPIDAKMGPVDLVAYLHAETPGTGARETQQRPDTPDRFQGLVSKVQDASCCKATSKGRY